MNWRKFDNAYPMSLIDNEVLIYVDGEIGVGKLVIEPATKKKPDPQPFWKILYPQIWQEGSVTPTHWMPLPDKPIEGE